MSYYVLDSLMYHLPQNCSRVSFLYSVFVAVINVVFAEKKGLKFWAWLYDLLWWKKSDGLFRIVTHWLSIPRRILKPLNPADMKKSQCKVVELRALHIPPYEFLDIYGIPESDLSLNAFIWLSSSSIYITQLSRHPQSSSCLGSLFFLTLAWPLTSNMAKISIPPTLLKTS